jgi:hypothetical protein
MILEMWKKAVFANESAEKLWKRIVGFNYGNSTVGPRATYTKRSVSMKEIEIKLFHMLWYRDARSSPAANVSLS